MIEVGVSRPKRELKVGDEVYKIRFIPNIARFTARKIIERSQAMLKAIEIKDKKKREAKIEELSTEDEDELIESCVRDILQGNGYTWDKDWWDKYTDYFLQYEFIMACLEETNKKKAVGKNSKT